LEELERVYVVDQTDDTIEEVDTADMAELDNELTGFYTGMEQEMQEAGVCDDKLSIDRDFDIEQLAGSVVGQYSEQQVDDAEIAAVLGMHA
jgi:hypothetical protein